MHAGSSLKGDQKNSGQAMEDSDPQPYQNHFCSLLDTGVLDHPASKRRKEMVPKTVVTVRIESPVGMGKSEGPPSDSWSWRKYGQKPIKGSPFPRGYYRCSTSKGCSAKKQVERCKTDASMLIITYTSTHNHPGPAHPPLIQPKPSPDHAVEPNQIQIQKGDEPRKPTDPPDAPPHTDEPCLMQTSICSGKDDEAVGHNTGDVLNPHFDDQAQQIGTTFTTPKPMEENDFFDELEELPIHSPCTELMRSSLFDERIILLPAYSN